ncbi:MAG: PAS domain S-box protein [Sulfuriflexus sp.]|nr:PAS domain S-box protein [Sulfuriflexus sp.]
MDKKIATAIFEQAAVGIAQIETQTGKFVRINDKYCDIIGYTKDDITEATFMEITHPDDLQNDLDNMEKLKDGLINEFTMEKRYFHKNGKIVWVDLTVSPIGNSSKNLTYHIAVVQDITRRKEAEQERQELENTLKQQNDILKNKTEKLQAALEEIKTLQGIIPICSYCHNIRDDEGAWEQMESYISKHTEARFSHGICPKCLAKEMEKISKMKNKDK